MNRKLATRLLIGFASVALWLVPTAALAARLTLSPGTITVVQGSEYTQYIYIESTDQAANAVSGVVHFPKELVTVSSISLAGSAINFWTEQPAVNRNLGDIRFQGVIVSPGYMGTAGEVFRVRFKALATGSGAVTFTEGSILANDGRGTNIFTGATSAIVTVKEAPPPPAVVTEELVEPTSTVPLPSPDATPPPAQPQPTLAVEHPLSLSPRLSLLLIGLLVLLVVCSFLLGYQLGSRRPHRRPPPRRRSFSDQEEE